MARRPEDSTNWGGARLGSGAPRRSTGPTRRLHVQLDALLAERLYAAAADRRVTVAQFTREALVAHLNAKA